MAYTTTNTSLDKHVVQNGQWFQKVAYIYGYLDWQVLLKHHLNSELCNNRKHPEMLVPGDEVTLPDRDIRKEVGATEQCHRFRLKPAKDKLMIRLLDEDSQPIANKIYDLQLEVDDGAVFDQQHQRTNNDGVLEEEIPRSTTSGKLFLPDWDVIISLEIGHLRPIDSGMDHKLEQEAIQLGVTQRLDNLLFGVINEEDEGAKLQDRIRGFQQYCHENQDVLGYDAGPVNGVITLEVRNALIQMHDDEDDV